MCARCAHLCTEPGWDSVHFFYSAVLCTCSLNSSGTTLKSKVKPWIKVSGTPLLAETMCMGQGLFGEGAHWVLGRVGEAPAPLWLQHTSHHPSAPLPVTSILRQALPQW